ncbi:hypothetical protein RUM44_009701 [Polyplax serrata]|uniref:Uncharacterized protein n=1 Tax=Polyplax serrata TaxID=468196 RepID=A0ABR1ATF3_POLSC
MGETKSGGSGSDPSAQDYQCSIVPFELILCFRPSQQATKIIQELQASCNSPNKDTQLGALVCWDKWISNHHPEDWNVDSICQFAVKPLSTKKLHPLHKDGDICKLKLNIMWKLLLNIQTKMEHSGPQHILTCFVQSAFTWLSSINHLEKDVTVLILKLLLILFSNNKETVTCETYTFLPLSVEICYTEKLYHTFVDKFLDAMENWKKIEDCTLIMALWKLILEHCEFSSHSIPTTVWHRIFKVNQTLCSDVTQSVQQRLAFLHACSTNVKTVLLSSKYIGGESCFMTPCEVMLKKLVEICTAECEESPDREIFVTCEQISNVLTYRSVELSDYDLCINFLDSFDNITLKSCYWGSWCGLVYCYAKTLLAVDRKYFTKNQMKFYRKLRAATVNFELDKQYLDEESVTSVYDNIRVLDIECFCTLSVAKALQRDNYSFATLRTDKTEDSSKFKVNNSQELVPVSINSHNNKTIVINSNCSGKTLRVTFNFDSGKFGEFSLPMSRSANLRILPFEIRRFRSIFETMPVATKKLLLNGFLNVDLSRLKLNFTHRNKSTTVKRYISMTPVGTPTKVSEAKSGQTKAIVSAFKLDITPKRNSKGSRRSEKENKEYWVESSPRTRSRIRAEELTQKSDEVSNKKKRKSFEVLVQEIVEKNRLRKTGKNINENILKSPEKGRELRSRSKGSSPAVPNREGSAKKIRLAKREICASPKRTNEEDKVTKVTTNGKLEKFFKILNSSENEKKEVSPKLEMDSKQKVNRKTKGTVTWKQTSLLKTIVREGEEKTPAKISTKKNDQNDECKSNETATLSPFKEVLHDHEYAKSIEPSNQSTEKNGKKVKKKKKRRRRTKCKSTTAGTKETEIREPVTKSENAKISESVDDKENDKDVQTEKKIKVDSMKEEPAVTLTESVEQNKEIIYHVNEENRGDLLQEETKTVESSSNAENISCVSADESCKLECQKTSHSDIEQKTEEDCEVMIEEVSTEEAVRGQKRVRESDSPVQEEVKKFKSNEDEVDAANVQSVEKENMEMECENNTDECISPVRVNSKTEKTNGEIGSPKSKTESPTDTSKTSKLSSRTISSRALKMIALVPDSNVHGSQTSWDLSPKGDPKVREKKFTCVNRSSRVSRMLANLTKQMPRVVEDSIEDEKMNNDSHLNGHTTPSCRSPVSKLMSPRSGKKVSDLNVSDTRLV